MNMWPFTNHKEKVTKNSLLQYAEEYFQEYLEKLTSGQVKGKVGLFNITVSFTVDEEQHG